MKRYALFFFAVVGAAAATAQSSILLEACNSIADSGKRLACLQELMNTRPAAAPQPDPSLERVKNAFIGIQGAVDSGISYNAYAQLVIEPASALAIYKNNPKSDAVVVELFSTALSAYKDAQSLWRSSIHDSHDAGAFGRIFNYRRAGMEDIVRRYRLPVTTVLFTDHLYIEQALPRIWARARNDTKTALSRMDPGSAVENEDVATRTTPAASGNGTDSTGVRNPGNEIYVRTGLRLGSNTLLILDVDKDFANSQFPVGGVLEFVERQAVSSSEQLMALIDQLKKGQAGYDVTVRYNGVSVPLFLEVR